METKLQRVLLIELIGSFGLVFFSAGLVCINQLASSNPTAPLSPHQPGVFGIALGQGLIFAALLALTAPITGGYLNPAITLMLWVFNRVETPRAAGLMAVQFLGGILAAVCLHFTFAGPLLQAAQFGAPHINVLAYHAPGQSGLYAGTAIEMLLTFFLVFAIFGMATSDALRLGIVSGMIATVCVLFGFPLTGAALNPARWLGPTLLEAFHGTKFAWSDMLVYLAGPILGSLLGGFFVFKIYAPASEKK